MVRMEWRLSGVREHRWDRENASGDATFPPGIELLKYCACPPRHNCTMYACAYNVVVLRRTAQDDDAFAYIYFPSPPQII